MQVDAMAIVANTVKNIKLYHYHRFHAVQVNNILKNLEGTFGKISTAYIKLADEYAQDVLGKVCYAPWLYVYTAVSGCFKEGWIPDNYYERVVIPKMKGQYGTISNLKPLNQTIFKSDIFPDVAIYVNGLFFTTDNVPIPQSEVVNCIFKHTDKIAFKVDNTQQGVGVYFFDKKTFDIEKIKVLGNGVFQNFIIQHKIFHDFAPNSVATLRITTVVDDNGAISVRACYLRLGRSADSHVQSRTHVRIPVNILNGQFSAEGYLTSWLPIQEHPDTHIKFMGYKIPVFSECISTVIELHQKIPFVRCVGWDVAIDCDDNVRLIEWNAEHNDIKFSEATQGPCFADLRWDLLSRSE